MGDSNFTELKAQFGRMQREISATLVLLEKLKGNTVILGICPPYCAPTRIVDPPRLDHHCAVKIGRIEGAITVQDAKEAIVMLDRWMQNMIKALNEAKPDMPLP